MAGVAARTLGPGGALKALPGGTDSRPLTPLQKRHMLVSMGQYNRAVRGLTVGKVPTK